MNIEKILKFYMVFLLCISAGGALTYNSSVKESMTSILHSGSEVKSVLVMPKPIEEEGKIEIDLENKFRQAGLLADVKFRTVKDFTKSFAVPGEEGAYMMDIFIETAEDPYELEELGFEVIGLEKGIKGGRIVEYQFEKIDETEEVMAMRILAEAKNKNGILLFKNLDLSLEANTSLKLSLLLDLTENVKVGDRIKVQSEFGAAYLSVGRPRISSSK